MSSPAPQRLAFTWHVLSFLGRLSDFRKRPSRGAAIWLAWEVVGVAWSLVHLRIDEEEEMERRVHDYIDK